MLMLGLTGLLMSCQSQQTRTPASWFAEATTVLQKQYYGFEAARISEVIQTHQKHLDEACQQTCTMQKAEQELEHLLTDLNDPHTSYRDPQETREDRLYTSGDSSKTPTLGLKLGFLESQKMQVVLMVKPSSPAAKAGLQRGDVLQAINGKPFNTSDSKMLQQVVSSGKPVTLNVLRKGKAQKPLTLKGEVQNAAFMPALVTKGFPEGVALLSLPDLGVWQEISGKVHALVAEAQQKNIQTLILDLRNNPGGYVWEMLSAGTAFMERIELINAYQNKQERLIAENGKVWRGGMIYLPFVYRAPEDTSLWKGKLLVLVNARTASAGEYLAYNLQQQKRATIIGETTRGLLNTTTEDFDLSNGGSMAITSTRTLDAQKNPYPDRLTPDVPIEEDLKTLAFEGQDLMLQKALQMAVQQVR